MSRFEGIIFDWAGTTVDYGCFAPVQAFIEAFLAFGVKPTVTEVRRPMGLSKLEHIRTLLQMAGIRKQWMKVHGMPPSEEDAQAIYRIFEDKLFAVLPRYTELKPGVAETVRQLRARGLKIGSTTGYTDQMMEVVAPEAEKRGYAPDVWFSPSSTGEKGRPYPYMIFKNMEVLRLKNVRKILKVGDTAADIIEGKNAGVCSAAIVIGSSEMGLSEAEYEALLSIEKEQVCQKTADAFIRAGADQVFNTMSDLLAYAI